MFKHTILLAAVAGLVFALGAGAANANLIGHWKFDEGAGTTAADSSANGYDADQTVAAGSWITGKAGGAYNLPRFSLDATESDVLNLAGTDAVTLSVWVTARTGTSWEGIAGFEGTGGTGDIYSLKMEPTNTDLIVWTVNNTQVKSTDTLANYAAATGDGWVHLVGVFDQGDSTLYVNGSPVNTGTAASPIVDKTPPGTFNIGRYFNTTNYQFTGAIDDVQVYNGALSADDVAFLFNNPGSMIPEPATFALLLLGSLLCRRRRA